MSERRSWKLVPDVLTDIAELSSATIDGIWNEEAQTLSRPPGLSSAKLNIPEKHQMLYFTISQIDSPVNWIQLAKLNYPVIFHLD